MKRYLIVSIFSALLAALPFYAPRIIAAETNVKDSGADGSSVDKAIVIRNKSNYENCESDDQIRTEYGKSIDQEYTYLTNKFGMKGLDWNPGLQSLVKGANSRDYDQITVRLSSGETKTIYFDVTEPYEALIALEKQRTRGAARK